MLPPCVSFTCMWERVTADYYISVNSKFSQSNPIITTTNIETRISKISYR